MSEAFAPTCPWCRQRTLFLVSDVYPHRFACRDAECEFLAQMGGDEHGDGYYYSGLVEGANPEIDTNGGIGWGKSGAKHYFYYMTLEAEKARKRREAWERSKSS